MRELTAAARRARIDRPGTGPLDIVFLIMYNNIEDKSISYHRMEAEASVNSGESYHICGSVTRGESYRISGSFTRGESYRISGKFMSKRGLFTVLFYTYGSIKWNSQD